MGFKGLGGLSFGSVWPRQETDHAASWVFGRVGECRNDMIEVAVQSMQVGLWPPFSCGSNPQRDDGLEIEQLIIKRPIAKPCPPLSAPAKRDWRLSYDM